MPESEECESQTASEASSRVKPIAANCGAEWFELALGLALCATTQIEHDAVSVRVAWWCVDSNAAVQTIRDRHIHADHFTQIRIFLDLQPIRGKLHPNRIPASGIDSFQVKTVIHRKSIRRKLL